MTKLTAPVEIFVLGKGYRVTCNDEERKDLLGAAQYLNDKVREIKTAGRVVGNERVLAMAALNIANELLQERRGVVPQAGSTGYSERIAALVDRIEITLNKDEQSAV